MNWLNTSDPRTILLHIGTNDINQNYDVANAPARLSTLIDHILQQKPNVQLFVAQIITEQGEPHATMVNTFNAAIPGIVASKGPNVHLVDMHAALTDDDVDRTVEAVGEALTVYAKALDAGSCAGLLRGRPVAPALRRYAAPRQIPGSPTA